MFYERLNELCKAHGTNITELATSQLGVAASAATAWRKGSIPRADVVVRAAEYFCISTDYLLGLTSNPLPPAQPLTNIRLADAIAQLQSASPAAQEAALAAMKAIIDALDK